MPRYKVTAPDGSAHYVNAPEGASQQQALDFFRQNYKAPAAEKDIFQKLAGNDEDGHAQGREDFMRAAWHHASGLPLGAAQLAMNVVGQGDGINKYMNDREAEYRSKIGDTAAGDLGAVMGELVPAGGTVGYIGKGVKAASNAVKRAPMLAKALGYTGEGAALGALQPVAGDDFWGSKGAQAATGAALQPVASAIGAGAGKLVNGVASHLRPSDEARQLAQAMPGVKLPWWKATEGGARNLAEGMSVMPTTKDAMRRREEQMFRQYNQEMAARGTPQRLPVMDEAGNVLRWEANAPSGKVGAEYVDEVGDQFGKAYGALYNGRTIPVDQKYMSGVQGMLDEVRNYKPDLLPQVEGRINQIHGPLSGVTDLQRTVTPGRYDQMFNRTVGGSVNEQGGHVGVGADNVKEAIAAAHNEAAALAREGKHGAAQYMRDYAGQLEGMRMRGLPPEVAGEMAPLNESFRNFAQYRQGMMNPAAQTAGMMTPQQHLRAIMQNGRKYGGMNTAAAGNLPNQADATLASQVMGTNIPKVGSGTGEKMFAMMGAFNPKLWAADYVASKAMQGGALPRVLTGDTSTQRWLQGQQLGKKILSNALRATPGVIGGQQGVE